MIMIFGTLDKVTVIYYEDIEIFFFTLATKMDGYKKREKSKTNKDKEKRK